MALTTTASFSSPSPSPSEYDVLPADDKTAVEAESDHDRSIAHEQYDLQELSQNLSPKSPDRRQSCMDTKAASATDSRVQHTSHTRDCPDEAELAAEQVLVSRPETPNHGADTVIHERPHTPSLKTTHLTDPPTFHTLQEMQTILTHCDVKFSSSGKRYVPKSSKRPHNHNSEVSPRTNPNLRAPQSVQGIQTVLTHCNIEFGSSGIRYVPKSLKRPRIIVSTPEKKGR
nr:uncharacterized protein CI109_004377 [Kwoniella shandongensis]KAA5527317.1 hypothetical protein CI109_004377 [Kwoniella shandongensis]